MILTLHGLSTMHSNIKTEIRIANELSFDGLEIVETKLLRYINLGLDVNDLAELLDRNNIKAVCINAIKNVESDNPKTHKKVIEDTVKLCRAAAVLGCPTIQLVPFNDLEGRPFDEIIRVTADNIREITTIGLDYNVRFQLEPIAFSPINSLSKSLKLIDAVGMNNLGMVIDFWHLWAGGETKPEEVAALKKESIYGIHFCDGIKKQSGEEWDEAKLRAFLPGEGDIPILEWVDAVNSTGYEGSWSSELYSPTHWEWDLNEIAQETKERMLKYIK